jgi:agmatine deiminase
VILPRYAVDDAPDWVREKDEKARQVFQQVYKNRQVKMIDALELNYKGGGLHCITLSKPKPKKGRFNLLRIRKGSLG